MKLPCRTKIFRIFFCAVFLNIASSTVAEPVTNSNPTGISKGNSYIEGPAPHLMRSLSRHALIIGISQYFDPRISTLKGIKHDMDSATKMAESMGVPKQNIRYIRDLDATAAGIEREIMELNSRVQPGDRVFFYFSGHGTRWYDAAIKKDECVEGLMPADSKPLTNERITALLKPVADKSDKLFMFYDACHSGGVVDKPSMSRAITSSSVKSLTPKFISPGGSEQCFKPVNIKDRSFAGAVEATGLSPQNVVQISSARPEEVSFDDEHIGGLATETWKNCMLGEAKDLDHSGGVTVEEIAACAQVKLTEYFTTNKQYATSHITIGGNRTFIPAWFSSSNPLHVTSSPIEHIPALPRTEPPRTTESTSLSAQHPTIPPSEVQQAYSHAALKDIYSQRNANRRVTVELSNLTPRIGKDPIELSVTSDHAGYLYVVMLGSDNKSFSVLFPNDLDSKNLVEAGKIIRIPRESWAITAQGPAGTDQLLVAVTDTPRDLKLLGKKKDGPFLQSLTDQAGRVDLHWLIGTSSNRASADCSGSGTTRNLFVAAKCSDSFGAALVQITER